MRLIWQHLAKACTTLLHRSLLLRLPLPVQVPLPMLFVPVRWILATDYLASSNTGKAQVATRRQLMLGTMQLPVFRAYGSKYPSIHVVYVCSLAT